ncbi:MAG: ABC transporter permease [Acidimicrobiales bacterium]|jgi:ribose transport system permease protein
MSAFTSRPAFERNRPILLAYALVVVLAIFGELVAGGFLSASHIDQLLIEASFIAFVALGQLFVIMSGGIDLSIPWVLNGAAVLLTIWANGSDGKTLWLFPVLLAGGALVGLLNGVGVMFLRIPPIIMTLGMSSMVEGALLLYTNGGSGSNAPSGVVYVATHRWGPVPVVAVVWLAVLMVATVVLSATPFGRRLYATGLNRRVAEFSGVNVRWVTVSVYVISGVAAALAGLVLSGYVGESYLGMGDPYLFESVAAVAIGGASVLGGTGNYVGTTAGALVLALLAAILPVLGFSQATLEIVYGLVILVAVSLSSLRVAANRSVD